MDSKLQGDVIADMYKDYFLDYASYVILERAIPSMEDGLKPVQRRILHAMFQMHDGRYHKVANIIGQTMQYHPHGDASIGEALVSMGQKDLLIDCQGNWGDVRTGDPAAAPRYIEARLTKFALDVVFNPKITQWQLSYDGRKNEPVNLPVKFPLLLAQGVEGIAVGLSTKVLPHNFNELIKASIEILRGKSVSIYPDFPTGGSMDVSQYSSAKRGGKIKVRAKIEIADRKSLILREIPFGTTTEGLIESIKKAVEKNKLKVKQITDKTAEHVEILIELPPGTSPEQTLDALYAFTDCESSISPNICVIRDDKPLFLSTEELLRLSTEHTKELLRQELLWQEKDLEQKWHYASLEKIFIEHKIYQRIEDCETWAAVLEAIDLGLQPHIKHLRQPVTPEDIQKLTEIKIKRISKYDQGQADRLLKEIEDKLEEIRYNLANLTDFAVDYFKRLLKEYGKNHERKTEITTFETIEAAQVILNNEKLYINREEGFIGYGLKKDEFIEECSTLDDVIVFHADGSYSVVKIAEKLFIGKNPLHVAIWRKQGVDRMIYNLIYADLDKNINYAKRFAVTAITRDKKYPIATGVDKAKVLYFSANSNGEAEIVKVQLTKTCSAKNKEFDYDFAELEIKGRAARGNILTKYPIRKISFKKAGPSTLDALRLWLDESTGRLSHQQSGEQSRCLGIVKEEDRLIAFYQDGSYEMTSTDLSNRFEMKEVLFLQKLPAGLVCSAVYYDGERKATYAKRFGIETSTLNQKFSYLPNEQCQLQHLSLQEQPKLFYKVKVGNNTIENKLDMLTFVEVMTRQALGSKVWDGKLLKVWEELPQAETGEDNTKSLFD